MLRNHLALEYRGFFLHCFLSFFFTHIITLKKEIICAVVHNHIYWHRILFGKEKSLSAFASSDGWGDADSLSLPL